MQEFSEDLSSAAGAAASRFGTNVMGAFSLAAFRKAEAAAAEGERGDEADPQASHGAAEASSEVGALDWLPAFWVVAGVGRARSACSPQTSSSCKLCQLTGRSA